MAIVGSVVGSFERLGTDITLTRPDLFDGATPKAAIVTVTQDFQGQNSYNENLTGIALGVGAITPDEQWACGISNRDGEATAECGRRQQNGYTVALPYSTTGTTFTALMTGELVADGITLTKSGSWIGVLGGNGELFIEVTFFGGDDLSAWIPTGSYVTSDTRVGGIPFMPNTGFFAGIGHTHDVTALPHGVLSQGWLFDNGVDTHRQCSRLIKYRDGAYEGDSIAIVHTDNFYSTLNTMQSEKDVCAHTDFDTDGSDFEHNYVVQSEENLKFMPLYMRLENEDCYVGPITLPSSTGTYTSTGYGHDPMVVKVYGNSAVNSYGSMKTSTASGNNFDWTIEGAGTSITTWNNEDADPTSCHTRLDLGLCMSYDDPASGGYRAINAQRIANGFSMEVAQTGAVAAKGFVVTLGSPVEGGFNIALGDNMITTAYLGANEVSTVYHGSNSLGGTAGWGKFYRDSTPAQNEGDWDAGPDGSLSQDSGGILWTATAAAFASVDFDFTTVPGEDYRITVLTESADVSLVAATQDVSGTAITLVPNITMGSGSTSARVNFKALSTSTKFALVGVVALGETILIESFVIEEMR